LVVLVVLVVLVACWYVAPPSDVRVVTIARSRAEDASGSAAPVLTDVPVVTGPVDTSSEREPEPRTDRMSVGVLLAGGWPEPVRAEVDEKWRVVREGDTLWDIAYEEYGRGSLYGQIEWANPGLNPHRIRPGDRVRIPKVEDASSFL